MTTQVDTAPDIARARPLTDGEMTAARAVAVLAAALGLLGFVNSFRAVARAAQASFGELAPTVPLGIDLAIAVFSAMDIVLARLDMRPRWVRLVPWSLTAVTIYLNAAGQPAWSGRVAHAVFPALWVVAVSLAAHVIRARAQLTAGTAIGRIRASRWLLAPLRTALLWRRMVLWEIRSYPDALARERARLLAVTGLQDTYGVLAWRWRAPRRVRTLYRLGELSPPHRRLSPARPQTRTPARRTRTRRHGDEAPDRRRPGGRAGGRRAGDRRTAGHNRRRAGRDHRPVRAAGPPDQEPAHRSERARALTRSCPRPGCQPPRRPPGRGSLRLAPGRRPVTCTVSAGAMARQRALRGVRRRRRFAAGRRPRSRPTRIRPDGQRGAAGCGHAITGRRDGDRLRPPQIGKPYLWGGTGPDAYDCSGLVWAAYQSAGVDIPRTSQAQWAGLPHVPPAGVRPGDLVFFPGSDGTFAAPGHVALVIGSGQMIQAYATGTPIEVSPLNGDGAGGITGYARPGGAS